MAYELLGKKVLCKAYLRKVRDGVFIQCYDDEDKEIDFDLINEAAYARAISDTGESDKLDFVGETADKVLFEKVTCNPFYGYIVGEKDVATKEVLIVDHFDDTWTEYNCISKQVTAKEHCYVVYFANNRKHYVPVADVDFNLVEKKEC